MKPTFALYRRFLTRYLAHCRAQVALLGTMLLAHTVTSVYAPQVLRGFIDGVAAGSAAPALARAAALFLAVAAGRQLSRGLIAYFGESVAWSATNRLRTDLLRHTVGLDLSFVNRHTPGVMLERIDGDSNQLATFFSQLSLRLLRGILLLAGILIALLIEDWRLCLALLGFAAAVTLILVKLRSFGVPYHERLRAAAAHLHGFVEERLAGLEDLKALGGVVPALRRMTELVAVQVERAKRAFSLGALVWPAVNVAMGIGTGLMLAWGGALALRGEMTIGTVYLLFSYLNLMFWPFEDLAHQMEELQKAGGNLVRIQRLFAHRSSLADGARGRLPARPVGVAFDQVSFRYPAGASAGAGGREAAAGNGAAEAAEEAAEEALRDLSFSIEAGRVLGILGRTGSGKTTVTRLLARLYDPTAGRVTLNGVDLREFRLSALRAGIAVVTQDVQFFRGTIRDNLRLFDPAVGDGRLLQACDRLGMAPWLARQPEGLDTVISSAQLALSAGEAQRLAVARAFLRDPAIVVLDEAAARLDPATERDVEHALKALLAGRTGVVIAHRLRSVEKVDDVLILERGGMAEYGPRQALLDDPASRLNELLALGAS